MERSRSGEMTSGMITQGHFTSQRRCSQVCSDSLRWFAALSVVFGREKGTEGSVQLAGSLKDADGLEFCRLV